MSSVGSISALVASNIPVTLHALGGIGAITLDDTASPIFPLAVNAIVAEWNDLDEDEIDVATSVLVSAIRRTGSGVALNDTCLAVVPAASKLAITFEVKDALRDKASLRSNQQSAGLAAVAIRWLAHLAVVDDEARPALTDLLTGVARKPLESMSFAVAAAQVAGLSYDQWRDGNAEACLDRLTTTEGEADAWFALGQARLIDALEEGEYDACLVGLRGSIACFDHAANVGEQRPDAVMYCEAMRFIVEWASGATAAMLERHHKAAQNALHEYMLLGRGLRDQPMWLRPRFEAEAAWIDLVRLMESAGEPDQRAWYQPSVAIGALADVYRAANSFRPRRTLSNLTSHAFPDLVAPRLTASFIEHEERLAYVEIWLEQCDDPDAESFAAFVRERTRERVVLPKVRPSGRTRR